MSVIEPRLNCGTCCPNVSSLPRLRKSGYLNERATKKPAPIHNRIGTPSRIAPMPKMRRGRRLGAAGGDSMGSLIRDAFARLSTSSQAFCGLFMHVSFVRRNYPSRRPPSQPYLWADHSPLMLRHRNCDTDV